MNIYEFFVHEGRIMENTYHVIFLDPTSSLALHFGLIPRISFTNLVCVYDQDDLDYSETHPFYKEFENQIEKWGVAKDTIILHAFSFFSSLLQIFQWLKKIRIDTDKELKFLINASTQKLPAILAFTNMLEIFKANANLTYSLFYLKQDLSGNWANNRIVEFNPSFIHKLKITINHLTLLLDMKKAQKEVHNQFSLQEIQNIVKNYQEFLLLDWDQNYALYRKRIYDLLKPLIEVNLIVRNQSGKRVIYSLNDSVESN